MARYARRNGYGPATLESIIRHRDVIALPDSNGPRYTTRQVLDSESEVLQAAQALAGEQRHAVLPGILAYVFAAPKYRHMTPEQRRAVHHATQATGLALIDGQAGTGKSYVLGAIREAYQAEGYSVIGLAPTNAVAQDLRDHAFTQARTLHSELFALDNGYRHWTPRTAVLVDEAAMLDTRLMQRLTAQAGAAGAKLILAGDDRQLASIGRGGMFALLKERYGAAPLTEVKRQQRMEDRRASQLMARGDFQEALASYQREGGIHWTASEDEARAALVRQWAIDNAADPSQSRFVFAYTNKDVDRLNQALREVRQERGELGPDHFFQTKHGRARFAAGDRLQLTGTDKQAGLFNGEAGTLREIKGSTLTIALDGPGNRLVSFDAEQFHDFKHGYAGTIYKGQGRTIDRTYLFHSQHWRADSGYVALTRHRDTAQLFVARETAADLPQLARQISRVEDRRAASHFLQSQFRQAAKQAAIRAEPKPTPQRRQKRRTDTTDGFFKAPPRHVGFSLRHRMGQLRQWTGQLRLPILLRGIDYADLWNAPPDELQLDAERLRQWQENALDDHGGTCEDEPVADYPALHL